MPNDTKARPESVKGQKIMVVAALASIPASILTILIYGDEIRTWPIVCTMLGEGSCVNPPPPPPPSGGGLSVSITGAQFIDQRIAAELGNNLKSRIGEVAYKADGYRIIGVVSETKIAPSGNTSFNFIWQIAKGSMVKNCEPLSPIAFPNQMKQQASIQIAEGVRPMLSKSVRVANVRC